MKRVLGYLRVSGKGQLDGDGFDRQRDAITAFAVSKGWAVARFFEEQAVSGTVEAMDRPAFCEMMKFTGGQFDTIIVERADRLARDLIVSELLFEEARKSGVKIFEAASGEELVNADSDPTRKLIRQVLGALAEWNRNEIVKKLAAARKRIRMATGRCEGRKAWEDLNPENKHWSDKIVSWIEIDIPPHISGLKAPGPAKGSFGRIANWLNDHKIPSPGGVDKKWSRSNVFDVYNRVIEKSEKITNPTRGNRAYVPVGLETLVLPEPTVQK